MLRAHPDITRNPDWSGSRGYNITIQGDFGWILPPFDGVADATNNPDSLPTDIDPRLEDLVWREVIEGLTRPAPGVREESTVGGRRRGYDAASYLKIRREDLLRDLEPFCNPEAFMPVI